MKQPQPHPPHTRGTFHRWPQPLHTENTRFRLRLPSNTTPMQHACSHYNVFCNIMWLTRISLRTWQQNVTPILQLQNTKGEPIRRWNSPSHTRRTHEVTFIAGRSRFTRKKTRFRAPASFQHNPHATCMQPLQCVLQHRPKWMYCYAM